MTVCRDPKFDISQIQSTMRHMFLDAKSWNRTQIAGRGIAMAAATSSENKVGITCHLCQRYVAKNEYKMS